MMFWTLQGIQWKKCKNIPEKAKNTFFHQIKRDCACRIWSGHLNGFKLTFCFLYQLFINGDNINITDENNVAFYVIHKMDAL